MMLSTEYDRVYNEIRLLMQAGMLEAANHALAELISLAVTRGQIIAAYAIEDYLIEKLDEPNEDE